MVPRMLQMVHHMASLLPTQIVRHDQRIYLLELETQSQVISHRDRRRIPTTGHATGNLEGLNLIFLLILRPPKRTDLAYDLGVTLTLQSVAEHLFQKKNEDAESAIAESEKPGIEEIKEGGQGLLHRGPRSRTSSLILLIPWM